MSTSLIGGYTPEGFFFASDSLAIGTAPKFEFQSDKVRKIFEIHSAECTGCYGVMGNPVIMDDIDGHEIANFPNLIGINAGAFSAGAASPYDFITELCSPAISALRESKSSGGLRDYPEGSGFRACGIDGQSIVLILFMGYFRDVPFMARAWVYHIDQILQDVLVVPQKEITVPYHYGSQKISALVDNGDSRFAKYARPRATGWIQPVPLSEKIKESKGYIEAYGSDLAHELDENTRSIGGDAQICVIRPSGIEWIYGPATG